MTNDRTPAPCEHCGKPLQIAAVIPDLRGGSIVFFQCDPCGHVVTENRPAETSAEGRS